MAQTNKRHPRKTISFNLQELSRLLNTWINDDGDMYLRRKIESAYKSVLKKAKNQRRVK